MRYLIIVFLLLSKTCFAATILSAIASAIVVESDLVRVMYVFPYSNNSRPAGDPQIVVLNLDSDEQIEFDPPTAEKIAFMFQQLKILNHYNEKVAINDSVWVMLKKDEKRHAIMCFNITGKDQYVILNKKGSDAFIDAFSQAAETAYAWPYELFKNPDSMKRGGPENDFSHRGEKYRQRELPKGMEEFDDLDRMSTPAEELALSKLILAFLYQKGLIKKDDSAASTIWVEDSFWKETPLRYKKVLLIMIGLYYMDKRGDNYPYATIRSFYGDSILGEMHGPDNIIIRK